MMLRPSFENKRVLVTGHTGFKGAWLTRWLLSLGARVAGFSLPADATRENCDYPEGVHSLFEELELASKIEHHAGQVEDFEQLSATIGDFRPDFIFHLAAQALVRASYQRPLETFTTNVLGTLNLLEALRRIARPVVCVVVTSDKVYENREQARGYTEDDRLGGHDPYSSSKAMCELATASYRASFFNDLTVKLATARAGNVIGGGDWAIDRILPDCVRALRCGLPISVRNPNAVRPWQHVLEPLGGYLQLAAAIAQAPQTYCTSFNFGPSVQSQRSVADVVDTVLAQWPGSAQRLTPEPQLHEPQLHEPQLHETQLHETQVLALCPQKAKQLLGWQGLLSFEQAVGQTISWYREHQLGTSAEQLTADQIEHYQIELEKASINQARLKQEN